MIRPQNAKWTPRLSARTLSVFVLLVTVCISFSFAREVIQPNEPHNPGDRPDDLRNKQERPRLTGGGDESAQPGAPAPAPRAESKPEEEQAGGGEESAAQVEEDVPLVDLFFSQTKLEQVLAAIKQQTEVSVIAKGRAAGQRVDVIAQKEPVETALEKICSSRNWRWVKTGEKSYEIMDEQTYMSDVLPKKVQRKTFNLRFIKASEAQKAVSGMLTKGIGSVAADERTNKLFVTDVPQVLERITRLLEEIDVLLVTRVFYIKHANVQDLVDKIQVYKSPPGIIEYDAKTHQIIVTDTFENIKRMEMMIDVIDIGPEIRVYDINNIGLDGKLASEIEDAIDQVVTEDAFWKLDVNTGKLIVEDMPEIHEKIEEVLAAIDTPIKQVLIEAELVETSLSDVFSYSVNYRYGSDLFTAFGGEGIPEGVANYLYDVADDFTAASGGATGVSLNFISKTFQALVNASVSKGESTLLSQPRLIVKSNEPATIFVGGREPYLTTLYGDDDRYYSRSFTQSTVTVGLTLELTPVISNNGLVEMKINISNKDATTVKRTAQDQTYDLIRTSEQETETDLIIPSGETRYIAGITTNQTKKSRGGIPILSKIPLIGPYLFGSRTDEDTKRQILFFVTPTIVEEQGRRVKIVNGRLVEELPPEVKGKTVSRDEITSPPLTTYRSDEYTSPTKEGMLVSEGPSQLPELRDIMEEKDIADEYESFEAGPTGTFGEEYETPSKEERRQQIPAAIRPPRPPDEQPDSPRKTKPQPTRPETGEETNY